MIAKTVHGYLMDASGQLVQEGESLNAMQLVSAALARMKAGGLADYGRFPSNEQDFDLMVSVYVDAIQDAKGLDECIIPAARRLCSESGNFPSAGEFAQAVRAQVWQIYNQFGIDGEGNTTTPVLVPRSFNETQVRKFLDHQRQVLGIAAPALPSGEIPEGVDRRPSSIMARMSLKALE